MRRLIRIVAIIIAVIPLLASCRNVARGVAKETTRKTATKAAAKYAARETAEEIAQREFKVVAGKQVIEEFKMVISKSGGIFDSATEKALREALEKDSKFLDAIASETVSKNREECIKYIEEFSKGSDKLGKDPNFIRMLIKSYFAKKEGRQYCPIFELVAKEEGGSICFYTKEEIPRLVARYRKYRGGIFEIVDESSIKHLLNQELIPNVCYTIKGANGKKCSFFIDEMGRISSVHAKYMSPDEIVTEIINRTGDSDFGRKWDAALKKLRETSKGDDINMECVFRYFNADDVLPKYANVNADINGKQIISQSFENSVKRLTNTFTAAENNAIVKRYARKYGLNDADATALVGRMNDDNHLAKLIHENPAEIEHYLEAYKSPINEELIPKIPKNGHLPRWAKIYAGKTCYFNPSLNPYLKSKLIENEGKIGLFTSNGKFVTMDDLIKMHKKYPNGIPFTKEGFPDFSHYAMKDKNGNLIKIDIGELSPKGSNEDIKKLRELYFERFGEDVPEGYIPHHLEYSTELILVPKDIHEFVHHSGGRATAGLS